MPDSLIFWGHLFVYEGPLDSFQGSGQAPNATLARGILAWKGVVMGRASEEAVPRGAC